MLVGCGWLLWFAIGPESGWDQFDGTRLAPGRGVRGLHRARGARLGAATAGGPAAALREAHGTGGGGFGGFGASMEGVGRKGITHQTFWGNNALFMGIVKVWVRRSVVAVVCFFSGSGGRIHLDSCLKGVL